MKTVIALAFLLTSVADCVPSPFSFAGLDPLLRIQLEQAIRSDCPTKLVTKLDPNCTDQDDECKDETGGWVDPDMCREKCRPVEYCQQHPECNFQMEQCTRKNCAPVKVTQCPPNSGIETRKICTPTVSLSCSQQHHQKCGAGSSFNDCVLKAASCKEHVSNHCVHVPVLKGQDEACTIEIHRNCSQKDMDFCQKYVGQACRTKCERPSIKCENKCPSNVRCKKVPAQSCHRLAKEKVCDK